MKEIVYHYTSLEVLRKIIEAKTLRFSKMNSLNDKSEYKHGVQLLKNKITEFERNNNIFNKFETDLLDRFLFIDSLYSVSFTERVDDLVFWNSYYVDKTTPICIGFKSEKVFNEGFIINYCIYGDPYPIMSRERYFWFREIFERKNIINLAKNREFIHITFQTAHIKNKAFEIEKEWRAVNFKPAECLFGTFDRNGKTIEYFDQPFNMESICDLVIGPCIDQEANYQKTKALILSNKLNCLVRKSTIPLEL